MPQNIVTTTDPATHARMRKLLSASFSEKSLRVQQPLIESYADLLIKRFRDLATAPEADSRGVSVDMVDWINFFTVDIIGDLAFAESFDCLKSSSYHPWVKTLFNFLQGMVFAAAARFFPSVEWIFTKMIPRSVLESQRKHTQFANERINRRLDTRSNRPDLFTPFMMDNTNFENMSRGEIESTFAILIVAGSETTATTLCGIINKLTQSGNKAALDNLTSEIRKSFKAEAEITIEAIKSLPYLNAVISEGLRLCNPVPGGLPRVVPEGGDVYAGHFVPGNVSARGTFSGLRSILMYDRHPFQFDRSLSTVLKSTFHARNHFCRNAGCHLDSDRLSLIQITSWPQIPSVLVQQVALDETWRGRRCASSSPGWYSRSILQRKKANALSGSR